MSNFINYYTDYIFPYETNRRKIAVYVSKSYNNLDKCQRKLFLLGIIKKFNYFWLRVMSYKNLTDDM